jgi:hypothetical protein
MPSQPLLKPPSAAIAVYPDKDRYKCIFEIRSESSDRVYRISFDAAPGACYWVCSCPGNIRHGSCKHLESMGLSGRKNGRDVATMRKLGMRV